MKIAVASSSIETRRRSLASSRTSGRMPRTSPMPIWRKSDRYSSVASSPSDEAVEMITIRASLPPASATKRARIWRWRSLSSAPPIISRWPARACPGLGVAGMARSIANSPIASSGALDSIGCRPPHRPAPRRATSTRCSASSHRPRSPRCAPPFATRCCAIIPTARPRRRSPRAGPRSSTARGPSCATRCGGCTTTTPSRPAGPQTLDWPLDAGEAPRAAGLGTHRRFEPGEPSPWHQPQWRSSDGFRVPGRGLHGRPGRAGALDRRASHRRRGLARSQRALLAPLRRAPLRRARAG